MHRSSCVLLQLLIIVCAAAVITADPCEPDWLYYKSHCYKWFSLPARSGINPARLECRKHGGEVIVLDDQEEEDFISANFDLSNHIYLGINDNTEEGEWRTFSGGPTPWTKWNLPFVPNNDACCGDMGQENCAIRRPDSLWNDFPCSPTVNWPHPDFICEISKEQVEFLSQQITAIFRMLPSRYFAGYEYTRTTTKSDTECANICLIQFPVCLSVNYRHKPVTMVTEEDNCILNSGNDKEANYQLLPNQFQLPSVDVSQWVYINMENF